MTVAGSDLFGRSVRVEVGQAGGVALAWEGLRIGFSVVKSVGRTPNKATVEVYGLTRDSSAAFQAKNAVLRVLAGYGAPSELFVGDVDRAVRTVAGVEAVTKVEASDGGRKFRSGWISKTFAAETTTTQILQELATAAALPLGFVDQLPEVTITQPLTLNGSVRDALDTLAKAVGAEWSIQGGELQLIAFAGTTNDEAIVLGPDSGLVGSPTATDKGIEVVCLLQPLIAPGKRFKLDSRDYKGIYRANEVTHSGDSGWETEFYSKITAKAL